MAISSVVCVQSRWQNTAHRWWATAATLSTMTPQMAPIAAKMPEVLAATVERMRGFMIIDYASSWADQVPTLMGGVPEGRAAEHLKIVVPTLLVVFSLLQRHKQQNYGLSKLHCQQLIK